MNIFIKFFLFIFCCLVADAINHFYLTRLERRIGLSGSLFKSLSLNVPSYFQNILQAIILFSAMYLWNENLLIILLVVAILKISTEEKKYGYGPLNISGLASLTISIFYIHLIKLNGGGTGQYFFSALSLAVCLAGIHVFVNSNKKTLITITLNTCFINGYTNIKNLYILLPLAVVAYCLQMFCEWLLPRTNAFKSIKNGTNILLLSSFAILAVAVVWMAIERLQ